MQSSDLRRQNRQQLLGYVVILYLATILLQQQQGVLIRIKARISSVQLGHKQTLPW